LAVSLTIVDSTFMPPYFKVCKRNDPKLDECILEYGKVILPKIAYTGIPEYGMGPLDPLYLGKIDILKGSSLGIVLKDTRAHGLGAANLISIKFDLKKQHIIQELDVLITIKGKYNMDGQLLVVPLKGNGNFTVKLEKTHCIYQYHYELKKNEEDGLMYAHIPGGDLKCKFGKMTFNMENLFGGNKVLGDTMNNFMTENSNIMEKELNPPVTQAIEERARKQVNAIYHSIPYDEILPE